MKKGWEYKPIGEVCDKTNGLWKGKKEPFVNVGVIRNANFTKEFTLNFSNVEFLDVETKQYSTRKLKKGDLIIEKSGGSAKNPVGRAVLFLKDDGEYSFSNFTSILRIKDSSILSYRFLYLYLLYIYKRGDTLSMQSATTGIHNLDFEKYLSILVPMLPLAEQQRIVEYLDDAFAKIDRVKANSLKAIDEAKALFQSALTEAMTPKDGWKEMKVGEIGQTYTGTTPSKAIKDNYGDFMPFIRPSEINFDGNGGLLYDSQIKLSEKGVSNGRLFEPNSILMVCIGATIGKVGFSRQKVSCNQQINVLTPKDIHCGKFIYYSMLSSDFNKKVVKEGTSAQATLPIINKSKWEMLTLFIPPYPEQANIASRLDTISEKVKTMQVNYTQIAAECDALKQSILKQVFE
jgi:type I restriction enzyme S subunit